MTAESDDPYARVDYRSVIAWGPRIEREAPFFDQVFAGIPGRSIVDLGCGTGEHTRFFAARGWQAAGLDASESMLAAARDQPVPPNLRFVQGDLRAADQVLGERYGAAICLGNVLSFMTDEAELHRTFAAVAKTLAPGGRFLVQILNYEKMYARRERHLPLTFRPAPEGDGEIVFLRLFELHEGGRVLFMPASLRVRPGAAEPVQVVHSRCAEHHAWMRSDLERAFDAHGFTGVRFFGTMADTPFDPLQSPDLVALGEMPA